MEKKILYLWVEGSDDEVFVEKIIKPIFLQSYYQVLILKYKERPIRKIQTHLNAIKENNDDYIFFHDLDENSCVTNCKTAFGKSFPFVSHEKIMVVAKEIESWYLAGLDNRSSYKLKITPLSKTDNLTKEQFKELRQKAKFLSNIDFMQEALKYFDVQIAKTKNSSFAYFLNKHVRVPLISN